MANSTNDPRDPRDRFGSSFAQQVREKMKEQESDDGITPPAHVHTIGTLGLLILLVFAAACGGIVVYVAHAHLVGWWAMPMMITSAIVARLLPGKLTRPWDGDGGWVRWWDESVMVMWERMYSWVGARLAARRTFANQRRFTAAMLTESRRGDISPEEQVRMLISKARPAKPMPSPPANDTTADHPCQSMDPLELTFLRLKREKH